MKIEIIPFEKFIKVNNLKEITNPVVFEKGSTPTVDGLLSTEIFGYGSTRKTTFAYISLGSPFLHPFVYKRLKRMYKNIDYIIDGSKQFKIEDNGELILCKPNETGDTGLNWLYSNWNKIKWVRNDSSARNETIDLLEAHNRDEIFCKYFTVIPAYYRDANLSRREVTHDDLNDLYSKLIRLANLNKNSNEFDFVIYANQMSIEEQLVKIYDHLMKKKLDGKRGLLHQAMLGKTTTYGARLVISAPQFDGNTMDENFVSFEYAGVPLAHICSMFYPFVIRHVKRYLISELTPLVNRYPVEVNGETIYVKLQDIDMYFNDEYLKKKIEGFIYGYSERFMPVELPVKDPEKVNNKPVYMSFSCEPLEGEIKKGHERFYNRHMTWCDILYQSAIDICQDKHVLITRYPVTDYFSSFINKINVYSTLDTIAVRVGAREYKYYPRVDLNMPKNKVETYFQGSLSFSNLYLAGIGGDYDGDQVTCKPIFTIEANKACEEIMYKKSNFITIAGSTNRLSSNESIQSLYQLTRFVDGE